jgi:acetyl esterase/lipase
MRRLATALSAFLWLSPAAPGALDGTVQVLHTQEVYKTVGGTALKVDVFCPEQMIDGKNTAAIVFFHGGGWAFGSPDEFFSTCEHYARLGLVAFSVEYRLANDHGATPHPTISPIECVMDAKSAMRWVRANAFRFHLAPDRIVAAGQSAGGQLALSTAMIDSYNEVTDDLSVSCRPDAILLFSACVNTVEGWCDHLLGERRTQIWSISPTHHVRGGLPPTIAFHGTVDEQVPLWTVQFFSEEMKKAGNQFELRLFEGRRHYLGGNDPKYAKYFDDDILHQADDFLRHNHLLD